MIRSRRLARDIPSRINSQVLDLRQSGIARKLQDGRKRTARARRLLHRKVDLPRQHTAKSEPRMMGDDGPTLQLTYRLRVQ
jgi:hypothetical protein